MRAPPERLAAPGAWWSLAPEALLAALHSSREGLSPREAAQRWRTHGPNTVRADEAPAWPRLLLRQFTNPLVLILLFGAAVSLLLHERTEAAIILVIVAGSALLGFVQEWRASAAIARLRRRLALHAQVQRGGAWHTLPTSRLVPGDIVRLAAGHLVPADALVLEAKDFLVTEAALTGESMPVEKRPGTCEANAPLARRENCIYLASQATRKQITSSKSKFPLSAAARKNKTSARFFNSRGRSYLSIISLRYTRLRYSLVRVSTSILSPVLQNAGT
jgi:Mg2+-importing ATPase